MLGSPQKHMLSRLPVYFRRLGWRCEAADTYAVFWKRLNQYDYDAVVVAEQLSAQSLQWAPAIRSEGINTAVVFLLEEGRSSAIVAALDAGYDDVLPQPVQEEELSARLRAIARRQSGYPAQELELGALRIRADERQLWVGEQRVVLSPKEFDLLFYLARHRNRVVSKSQLSEYLWGDPMEEAETFDFLYAHVKNLRQKLRAAGATEVIHTVYGLGYTLRAGE